MRKGAILLLSLLVTLLAAPMLAQGPSGPVVRVATWKVRTGMSAQFEAGLKKHNQLHRLKNDPGTLETWQVTSGQNTGQYVRVVALPSWTAYDTPTIDTAADEADSAANVTAYLESEKVEWWQMLSAQSHGPMDAPTSAMDEILFFHLNMGHNQHFMHLITKVTEAAKKNNWSVNYYWYVLANGGEHPTYALVVPKKNMAAFEDPEVNFIQLLQKTFSPAEMQLILKGFDEAIHCERSEIISYREDLSYIPGK